MVPCLEPLVSLSPSGLTIGGAGSSSNASFTDPDNGRNGRSSKGENLLAEYMACMCLLFDTVFDDESAQFLQFTKIFEEGPLHYSAARRVFYEMFGSSYNFGSWLRKACKNGWLEVKHSKKVFGKRTCWVGLPGFKMPDDRHLCQIKRERMKMHNHLVRALEQSCTDFGLKFVRVPGTNIYCIQLPGLGNLFINPHQFNGEFLNPCHWYNDMRDFERTLEEHPGLARARVRTQRLDADARAFMSGAEYSEAEYRAENVEFDRPWVAAATPDINGRALRHKFNIELFHVHTPRYVPDLSQDYLERQKYDDCDTDFYVFYRGECDDGGVRGALGKLIWFLYKKRFGYPLCVNVMHKHNIDLLTFSMCVDGCHPDLQYLAERNRQVYLIAMELCPERVKQPQYDPTRYLILEEGKPPPSIS